MNGTEDRALLPWSHRRSYVVRVLITILAGAASGAVGTLAHRMGAAYGIPYGLALAFLILGVSTWCARARCNAIGIGFHLIASSTVIWCMAMYGPGGDAMIPIGFSAPMPFFVQNAGGIWLYGEIALQVVMLFLPAKWFVVPPREVPADDGDSDTLPMATDGDDGVMDDAMDDGSGAGAAGSDGRGTVADGVGTGADGADTVHDAATLPGEPPAVR